MSKLPAATQAQIWRTDGQAGAWRVFLTNNGDHLFRLCVTGSDDDDV